MSKIAGVDDNLHAFVPRGNVFQNFSGPIGGGIINEDMLVFIN